VLGEIPALVPHEMRWEEQLRWQQRATRHRYLMLARHPVDNAMPSPKPPIDHAKLDRIVAEARRDAERRNLGYRERALKMYPWICGRCGREFGRENLQELTVHHRNHDHDFNPPDGSNWELLCIYCHDNEHSRHIDHMSGSALDAETKPPEATSQPFAALKALLKRDP
jgi:hypothetical protein